MGESLARQKAHPKRIDTTETQGQSTKIISKVALATYVNSNIEVLYSRGEFLREEQKTSSEKQDLKNKDKKCYVNNGGGG